MIIKKPEVLTSLINLIKHISFYEKRRMRENNHWQTDKLATMACPTETYQTYYLLFFRDSKY